MSNRDIGALSQEMEPKCRDWCREMTAAGIDYLITCTLRTQAEQAALYAQGRTALGPIVTWTMNSKHLKGNAFDFVIMANGKPDWTMAHKDAWNKAIAIGKSHGLTQVVGKDGHVKEFAHLQLEGA